MFHPNYWISKWHIRNTLLSLFVTKLWVHLTLFYTKAIFIRRVVCGSHSRVSERVVILKCIEYTCAFAWGAWVFSTSESKSCTLLALQSTLVWDCKWDLSKSRFERPPLMKGKETEEKKHSLVKNENRMTFRVIFLKWNVKNL